MVDLLQNTLLILHMFNLLQSDQVVKGQGLQGVIGGGGSVMGEGDRGEGACNMNFVYNLLSRVSDARMNAIFTIFLNIT